MIPKYRLLFLQLIICGIIYSGKASPCATHSLTAAEKQNAEYTLKDHLNRIGGASALLRQDVTKVVRVHWHVIHDVDNGFLLDTTITNAVSALNRAFADSGSVFQFDLVGITYTDSIDWFYIYDLDTHLEMAEVLHVGDCSTLNIYSVQFQDDETLGYVPYYPVEVFDSCIGAYVNDGVWIDHGTTPEGCYSFESGYTLVHQVGHWMGLYHTFENGCDDPGDYVADTPAQDEPTIGCPSIAPDTCAGGGIDPINNYMDFSSDSCKTEFTRGQLVRMLVYFDAFREDGSGNEFPSPCFSPYATATVKDKGKVSMKDLAVGDTVLTASGKYQTVYTINHFHHTKPTNFLQIHTDLVDGEERKENALELTSLHLVYIVGKRDPVPAIDVQFGDYLQTLNYGPQKVTNITHIQRNGLYNPITTDGTILVDGILASSYTSFTGSAYVVIADVKLVSVQSLLDMTIAPYRVFCMTTSSLNICNRHREGELPIAVQLFSQFYAFWSEQNFAVQLFIFSIYVSFFGLIQFAMRYHSVCLLVAIAGWGILTRRHSSKQTEPKVT